MEVYYKQILLLLAQYTERGKGIWGSGIELGGLFDNVKINVDSYQKVIEHFKKIGDFSKYLEKDKFNWDVIAESIGDCDERALSYFKSLDDGNGTIDNQSASVEGLSKHLKETGQMFDFTAMKAKLLNGALNAGIGLVATFAIGAVIKGIDASINRVKYAQEAMEKAQQAIDESQNKLKSTTETISKNKDRFLELSQGVDRFSKNQFLSDEDYSEFLSISQQLAEISPNLIVSYDEQGNALLRLGKNAKETGAMLDEMLDVQKTATNKTLADNLDAVANGVYESVKQAEKQIETIKFQLNSSGIKENLNYSNLDIYHKPSQKNPIKTLFSFDKEYYNDYGKTLEEAFTKAGLKYTTDSDFKNKWLTLDSHDSNFTEENLKKAQKYYNDMVEIQKKGYTAEETGLKNSIAEKERLIDDYYSKISVNLGAWAKEDYLYQSLGKTNKNFVDDIIPTLDWDAINKKDFDGKGLSSYDYQNYIKENIIKPLATMPDSYKDEVTEGLSRLLEFKDGDLSIVSFGEELQKSLKEKNIEIDITPMFSEEKEASEKLQNSIKNIAGKNPVELSILNSFTEDFTEDKANIWEQATLGANSALEAISMYIAALPKEMQDTAPSFKSVFNSEDFRQSKEELLKLAEAGELSSATLSSTKEYQTLLEKTGMTAYEASQNIYNLISQSDRLSSFSHNMENLDKAYSEFKTNGYNSMDSLSGLENAFGNLSSYKSFIKTAGDAKSSTKQIQKAYNSLVDEYLNATGILSILNEQNKGLVQTQLEHLGITNAEELVANALNNSYLYLGSTLTTLQGKTIDVSNVTAAEIVSLYNAGEITKETMKKLADYVAMKDYANKTTLSTDGDIQNLADLALTGSELGQILYSIAIIKRNIAHGEAGGKANLESQLKELEARRDKLIKNFGSKGSNFNTTPNAIEKNNTKTTKKATDSYSKFAQTIDWCVQTINNMVNKIGLLNSKLSNTKALNKQISYYNSLIKAQQKLIKGYAKEENTYKKAYNKSLNKLSKADQNKVKNGTYTIEDFKGKAKSGKKSEAEKRYNNIQSALEARDTYLKAQTDLVNAKQQLNEYIETLAGIRWEKASESIEKINKKIEVLDAKASNLNGYKSKNTNLDAKVKAQYKTVKEQQSAVNKTQSDKDAIDKKALNIKGRINSKYKTNKRTNANGTLSEAGVSGKQLNLIKQYNLQIKKSNAYKKKLSEINQELAVSEQEYITLMNESIVGKANNIQQDYENRMSLIDAKENQLNAEIAFAEAKGQLASAKYYQLLNQNSKQRISELKSEKKALENQLKGLSEYSDAWYEVKSILISVDEQLAEETQNAVENITKQIEAVSNLTEAINNNLELHTDSDFYTSLTEGEDYYDKNGITDIGKSVLAAKYLEYTGKKQLRENLDKELNEINRQYLERKISESQMTQLTDEWLKKAQELDKEIISSQNAIGDMLTESYKTQLDGLKEIIDAKKKALSLDKSEYDYQKSIAEKTKSIATLQKQLAMLEGRNDEEANAERQKIQLQLEDAQEDLDDTQYDKYIERVENELDDLSERFSDTIDELSKTLNHVGAIESNIYDLISDDKGSIFEAVRNVFDDRGINLNDSGDWLSYMQSLAGNKDKKEDTFGTGIVSERLDQQTNYLEKIYEKIPDEKETGKEKTKLSVADVLGKASEKNKKTDTSEMSALNKYLVKQGYKPMSTSQMADLASALRSSPAFDNLDAKTKETISSITSANQLDSKKDINAGANKNALLKALKYIRAQEFLNSHLKEGIAGKNYGALNKYLYQTQDDKVLSKEDAVTLGKILGVSDANKNGMIDGKEGNEIVKKLIQIGFPLDGIVKGIDNLETLNASASTLTPLQTDAFLKLIGKRNPLNNTLDIIQHSNLPDLSRHTNAVPNHIENVNFTFSLPNVVDSRSLIRTIQSDTQVQRTLQNATVGKLNGNTKFGVNKL